MRSCLMKARKLWETRKCEEVFQGFGFVCAGIDFDTFLQCVEVGSFGIGGGVDAVEFFIGGE